MVVEHHSANFLFYYFLHGASDLQNHSGPLGRRMLPTKGDSEKQLLPYYDMLVGNAEVIVRNNYRTEIGCFEELQRQHLRRRVIITEVALQMETVARLKIDIGNYSAFFIK